MKSKTFQGSFGLEEIVQNHSTNFHTKFSRLGIPQVDSYTTTNLQYNVM